MILISDGLLWLDIIVNNEWKQEEIKKNILSLYVRRPTIWAIETENHYETLNQKHQRVSRSIEPFYFIFFNLLIVCWC